MKAVIFIGHGSKSSKGNEKFTSHFGEMCGENEKFTSHFGKLLAKRGISFIGYGFLENAEPSIFQAVESAIQAGASEVTVVPVLLLPGIHANYDVPEALVLLKKKHKNVIFRQSGAIGSHSEMVNILIDRLKDKGHIQEEVILVAHGSRIPDSRVQFEEIAEMLRKKLVSNVQVAYITTAPHYQEVLAHSPSSAYVLPYLLFAGRLLQKLQEIVDSSQICEPIGFDSRLQQVLLEKMIIAKVVDA